jgi:large subunit ribosomal protein L3
MARKARTNHPALVLLGKKLGMTQVFADNGEVIPVTALQVGPCVVVQKKTKAKEGYNAIQLGFDDKKAQNVLKPEAGHFKAAKAPTKRFIKEFRLEEDLLSQVEVGNVLGADLLNVGDNVDITGNSIGKGFQGVMKRHNFAGKDAAHGTHEFFRHGGSIGMRSIPGRVFKNKKMAGHMGDRVVTQQNLTVAGVDAASNIVLIKGAVPGSKNGYVTLKASVKGGFAKRPLKKAPVESTPEVAPEAEATNA